MTEKTTERVTETQFIQGVMDAISNEQENITRAMQRLRAKPYETITLFDTKGIKLSEQTSFDRESAMLYIPPEKQKSAKLFMHNHITDDSFSDADLNALQHFDLQRGILVTPTHNYYLDRPVDGWPSNKDWLDDFVDVVQAYYLTHNYDKSQARHAALMRLTRHYRIPYFVTDLNDHVVSTNQPFLSTAV